MAWQTVMDNDKKDASTADPFRWMDRSLWQRFRPLRWMRCRLIGFGIGYVKFNGDAQQLWRAAMRHAPITFRWFGRSLTPNDLESELDGNEQWAIVKQQYESGDRIWPFVINPDTLAMRLGYVIVRNRKPVTGVVTVVS